MITITIKEIRKERKLTQTETARLANISQSMYSAIENGKRRPSPKVAKRLGDLFGFRWEIFYEEKGA